MRFRTSTLLLLLTAPMPTVAEIPDYVLSVVESRAGGEKSQVAVFTHKDKKVGFSLGCQALAARWTGAPQHKVTQVKWNEEIQNANVVADVDCKKEVMRDGKKTKGSTEKFQSTGEPGSFVIRYRDGTQHLHFVDNVAWFKAIEGEPTQISPDALRALVVDSGPDFHSKIKSPPPPPPPPSPANNCPNQFPSSQCISTNLNTSNKIVFANSCSYSVTLYLEDRCNGHPLSGAPVVAISPNSSTQVDSGRSDCSPLGGNTFQRSIAKACR